MCELLGLSFNKPVTISLSFRAFRQRSQSNPDGWGIAYYPDKAAQVMKEPLSAEESRLSKFIQEYGSIESKIFISHVRLSSVGTVAYKNTHPFERELFGKDFVFAHNGTLGNYRESLLLRHFKPIGETDSEYVFCHILDWIEEKDITCWTNEQLECLWEKLKQINDFGRLNCVFSDGEYLFCYHDRGDYKTLSYVERKFPFDKVRLKDEDFEINLSEKKDKEQRGYIVATRALTNEGWKEFAEGQMIVFKDGEIVFSSY